jgi:transcription initiation factor IIE alpha subunit
MMRFTNDWLRKRIEDEPDGLSCEAGYDVAVDAAFYCPRCGEPLSQDPETEKTAREAGMCALCVEAVKQSDT